MQNLDVLFIVQYFNHMKLTNEGNTRQ